MKKSLVTVALVALSLVAMAALPAGATETLPNPARNAGAGYDNGPWGPVVWTIGDSISALQVQKDNIAIYNASKGWHTHIEATGGATMIEHWRTTGGWDTFRRAGTSNASVVVVELGTNDISQIYSGDPQALQKIAAVFDYLTYSAAYLNGTGKCVVWVGMNEAGNQAGTTPPIVYDQANVAVAFDTKVKQLLATYPHLHYADYNNLIATNANFRNGLYVAGNADTIHPKTTAAYQALASWYTTQVHNSCGI